MITNKNKDSTDENTALLKLTSPSIQVSAEDNSHAPIPTDKFALKNIIKDILISTSSFGVRSLFVGIHYVGNGLIMSSLGSDAAAASSIVTTMQTFTIGASSGFLMVTGIELGVSLGRLNPEETSDAARMGWLMSLFFGGLSSAVFLSTRLVFPHILKQPETAKAAYEFFEGFAIAAIPDLLIWTNGQIIFQIEHNSYIPLLSTIAYRGSALGVSYLLAKELDYGPFGVGLGAGIAGWGGLLLFQPWFFRKAYRELSIYSLHISNFPQRFKNYMSEGWKLSLQRITEWGNLATITQIIGAWSNNDLIALQPSVLVLTLCNILSQGFGQASMMIATKDCTEIKRNFELFESNGDKESLALARKLIDKNYKNCIISTVAGLSFNMVLAGSLLAAKHQIIGLYVPGDAAEGVSDFAETLLWINAISLIPDAVRMISGNTLRGWGDLIFPTFVSLIVMSMIGIPLGYGIGYALDENIMPFFILRAILIAISAAANCFKIYGHTRKDENRYGDMVYLGEVADTLTLRHNTDLFLVSGASDSSHSLQLHGLTIEQDAVANGLFPILDIVVGGNLSSDKVKMILSKHISDNIGFYLNYFHGKTKENFLADITTGVLSSDSVLLFSASRHFKINIIVIMDGALEPEIIKHETFIRTIYLKKSDSDSYYLLSGSPNEVLRCRINAARSIAVDIEMPKQKSSFLSNCFFKEKRAANDEVIPRDDKAFELC